MKQVRSFFRGIGVLSTLWIAVCFSTTGTCCRNRGELLGEFKKLQYPALKDVGQKARVVNGNFPMDTASDRMEAE
jgi:hypothetical protein